MGYRDSIVREVQKVSPRCFICNHKFGEREYGPIHSGSGLHFELKEIGEPVRYVYIAMDPPAIYRNVKGKAFEVDEFCFGFRYFADAVRVCNGCHLDIHALALELCRETNPDFKGNTPTPRQLAEATFNYHFYRSPILA